MQSKERLVPNFVGLKAHTTMIMLSILLLGFLTLGSTPAFSQNKGVPLSKSTLQLLTQQTWRVALKHSKMLHASHRC